MNRKVRGGMSQWKTEMIQSFAPSVREKACWKDNPLDEPLNEEHCLAETLQKITGWHEPHLLLCGFWANNCVSHVSTEALRHGIRSTVVTDCTYPLFDTKTQQRNLEHARKKYPGINPSLLLFASQKDVLGNLSYYTK
tara:strand:- start:76 stop:489 length:414 start_codon:yes stop_codon:yes gene_type:complete